jgi:hypothetical protein
LNKALFALFFTHLSYSSAEVIICLASVITGEGSSYNPGPKEEKRSWNLRIYGVQKLFEI